MDMDWQNARSNKRKNESPNYPTSSGVKTRQKKAKGSSGRQNLKPPSHLKPSKQLPTQVTPDLSVLTTNPAVPVDITSTVPTTPTKTVKPVFVENNFQVVNNHVNSLQLTKKPYLKIINKLKIQVSCFSLEDKKKLIDSLNTKKLINYTYSEASEKSTIFVLRGFYKVPADEMLKILTDDDIKAKKVTFLSENILFTSFILS